MSQYVDNKNSLNHGLGVGGGRGRPKGSRNGYINPNAAYMKDYKIVGEIAQDPEEQTQMFRPGNRFNSTGTYRQPTGTQRGATGQPVQRVNSQKTASRPVNSVQSGKMLMEKFLKEETIPEKTIPERVITEETITETKSDKDTTQEWLDRVSNDPDFDKKLAKYLENHPELQSNVANYQAPELNLKVKDPVEEAVVNAADFARDNIVKPAAKAVGNAANKVGEVATNTARNVAKAADRAWNGYDRPELPENKAASQLKDQNDLHVNGIRENAEETVSNAANAVKDVYEDVKSNVESTLVNAGDQAKTWWDDLLNWGGNAVKSVGDFATSAINTGTKAFNDATKWVSDRFNDATSWASTAYKDVSDWIGDRGTELDRWWNGYDEKQVHGSPEKRAERQASHVNGVRENIEKAVGDATGAAGKWLTDRGEDLNRWWNGYDEKQVHGNPEKRAERQASHVNGARENIEAAVNNAANAARNAIGEASENVVRTVRDAAGNVHQAVVDTAGNIVGWVGERAEDVSNWWNGTDVVRGDSKGVTSVEHTPGVRENVEELVGAHLEKVRDAAGNIRDAIVDAKGQFVDWAGERIEEANEWWNGSDRVTGDQNGVTNVEHTPGARENIEKAIQDTGKAAAEAGEKAVSAARTAAGAGADIIGENIVGWTNSPIAQEAQKAGMSTPMLYALASAYLSGGPNGVDRNAYENMLSLYANGDLNDDNIWYAINDINHK